MANKEKDYQLGSIPGYGASMQMLIELGKKRKERQAMLDKMKGMSKSEKDKYIAEMRKKNQEKNRGKS